MMWIESVVCLGFLFEQVLGGISCNFQFATNYLCATSGAARPIAQIGSAPAVEVYFEDAWSFYNTVFMEAASNEIGGFVSTPRTVLTSTNGDNIPSDMDQVSNPENCTTCATDVFAPVGDTPTEDVVKATQLGWAFWNFLYISIWVASANIIFDTHCTGNCVSYHPSRKNYFRAGMENIIAMAPPPTNQTIYLFSNPSSTSIDVIAPLVDSINAETYLEAFWSRIDKLESLTASDVQTYLSAAPDDAKDPFIGATHPVDGVFVAAETGQVEPLLLGMSNQRPKRVVSMNTKLLVDHDVPENNIDNSKFAEGEQPNLRNCVMIPNLRIEGLNDLSRQWLWTISTASQREGWQGSSSLYNTWRYQFVQQALATISSAIVDVAGQPRDPWGGPAAMGAFSGYTTAAQIIGDARQDGSYLLHAFDPRGAAMGFYYLVYGGIARNYFLIDINTRYRFQNIVRDCATKVWFHRIMYGVSMVRRHIQNSLYWSGSALYVLSGQIPPPPTFPIAEDCYNPMGVIMNDPNTGENLMGMYLMQKNNVVLPVYPFLYSNEPIMETTECVPLPATTTIEQTTMAPYYSKSMSCRFLMMGTIVLFWSI